MRMNEDRILTEQKTMKEKLQAGIQTHAKTNFQKDLFVTYQLVSKDFKLKYRRSVLGVVWSVLNPLLMMVVQSIVFTYLFKHSIENYPLYLIVGNVTFSFMSDSTRASLRAIISASSLLKKVRIDRFVFPVQKVLFSLVNYAFSLVAVAVVMVFFQVVPTWHFIFFPVILLLLVLFCVGLGMALSALTVFFRDIIHLWSVVLTAWTYLTPIFWDFKLLVDNQAPHWIQLLVKVNPMYNYCTAMRDVFLWQQTPDARVMFLCVAWAVAMLLLGLWVFKKNEHRFILYI